MSTANEKSPANKKHTVHFLVHGVFLLISETKRGIMFIYRKGKYRYNN